MFTSPGENYKSTDFYRTMVDTKVITPSEDHEEYRFIPNHSRVGSTWDARHLDKFLNSKWGCPQVPVVKAKTAATSTMNSQATSPRGFTSTGNSQGTFYFKTGPRFNIKEEREYLMNYGKDFTIKETRDNINNLILASKTDQKSLKTYCEKELSNFEKTFDPSKLEFSQQTKSIVTPKDRISEMLEVRANQKEMAEWKNRNKEITKKNRVHKGEFKHGILGLDNPTNDSTMLYKKEHEAMLKSIAHAEAIERRRVRQLEAMTSTHGQIEFSNRNFKEKLALPLKRIVEKNGRIPVTGEHVDSWRNTNYRIFGEPPVKISMERAMQLREQETKGRPFDIISSASYRMPRLNTQTDRV